MKPQSSFKTTLVSPSNLSILHQDSRLISKVKPKIRIIHIVAPEIIKTDAENFRELVQNLTGNKPVQRKTKRKEYYNKENINYSSSSSQVINMHSKPCCNSKPRNDETSVVVVPVLQDQTQRVKEEMIEEIYPNGFLSNFLGDLDGFFQDVNEFPLFSLRSSPQISAFGEVPLC